MTARAISSYDVQHTDPGDPQLDETGNTCRSGPPRPGFTLLAVMLGIFLVGVFSLAILQSILQRHRTQSRELDEIQCRFLLHSGLERAAARLAQNSDYRGERWRLRRSLGDDPLLEDISIHESDSDRETNSRERSDSEVSQKALDGAEPTENEATPSGHEPSDEITEIHSFEVVAEVLIEVLPGYDQDANRKLVRVTARYPYPPRYRVQISEDFVVQVPEHSDIARPIQPPLN